MLVRRHQLRSVPAGFDGEMLRTLVETIDDAVIAVDDDLRIVAWSGAAERISGRRAADVLGRRYDFLVGTGATGLKQALEHQLSTGTLDGADLTRRRSDGVSHDLHTTASVIRDDDG